MVFQMINKTVKNVLYIIISIFILLALKFKFVELPELFAILLGFIGFAVIINSLFELGNIGGVELNSFTNEQTKDEFKFNEKDDLDKKAKNLANLANELLEENKQLKEELKKLQ